MNLFPRLILTALATVALPVLAHATVKDGLAALEKQEFQKAAELFAKAVEAKEPDGAFYLGRMMEMGMMGQQANMASAIEAYKQGVSKGSALAKNRLGMLHLEGQGVLQDFEEGGKMVCESADAGDANGQFNCGLLTVEGRGVPKDPKRGIGLLEKAVAQDHIGAKNILAQAYLTGNGVDKNDKKGLELFQQTASSGNPVGLFSLAQAYTLGVGVDKDLVKAHAYFNLAAARQHPEAVQARQMIEQQLKPEQVQEAQRVARAWRPVGNPSVTDKVKASDTPARPATPPAAAPPAPAPKKP